MEVLLSSGKCNIGFKHKSSMNDEIILELVKALNLRTFLPTAISESGKKFFVNEPWSYKGKPYRLIWFIPKDKGFLGVRNAFRSRMRSKHGKGQ